MKNNSSSELTKEQKKKIFHSWSSIEIMTRYCDAELCKFNSVYSIDSGMNIVRALNVKEYQDSETSLYINNIIVEMLTTIGEHYVAESKFKDDNPLCYALKEFLIYLVLSHSNGIFSDNQLASTKKLINEYILDEYIDKVKEWFLVGHDNIPQYEMLFLLHEFAYKSPICTDIYCFNGCDIRIATIDRIELTTMNKYLDHKLNINNIENQLFESLVNFPYSLHETSSKIFAQKEVQYRTSMLNELYFNFEYFLSVVIKTFNMAEIPKKKKLTRKQDYLTRVLCVLDINQHVDYKSISNMVQERSSIRFKELLMHDSKQTISLIDIFSQIINMRNSLHSNGHSNKDIQAFNIGKIHFTEVKKDEQFSSMAMHQVVVLMLVVTYIIEIIIDKLSTMNKVNNIDVPEVIEDKFVKAKYERKKQTK